MILKKIKFIILILIILLILGFIGCNNNSNIYIYSIKSEIEEFDKIDALVWAYQAVIDEKSLTKTMITHYDDTFVYQIDRNNFIVNAYIDDNNKIYFSCKVKYLGNNKCRISDLIFKE